MKKFLLLICLTTLFLLAGAQTRLLNGYVQDASGEPIIGANISSKGGKNLAVTNVDGKFVLNLPQDSKEIVVSYIGYKAQIVKVEGMSEVTITMKEDGYMLDEHVVIGYGTQKRSDLTGAVSTLDVEDIQMAPVKSFDEALAGRVAGVQVVSSEGKPGSSIDITIRGGNSVTGSNSPLYVIDGFLVESPGDDESNPINAIDPSDIETMTVLKDASATAIYGARGANGVVIINTKRGVAGKTKVSYTGYYGWQSSSKRLDVLSPYEFVRLQQEIDPVKTQTLYLDKILSDGSKEKLPLDYYKGIKGIDWEDQVMQTAPIQNHHLSILGGTEKTKISASLSYFNQEGIIIHSGFKRAQGRFTIDHEINSKMKFGVNASYARTSKHGTDVSASNYNSELNLLFSVWAYRPITLINSDVNLIEVPNDPEVEQTADFRYNPIVTTKNELRESKIENLTANAFLEYSIIKDLKLKLSGGYTRRISQSDVFNNSLSRSGNPTTNNLVNGGQSYANHLEWLNENTLTYNKVFNKHHSVNLLGGFTLQESDYKGFGAYAKLLPNESLGVYGLDEGTPSSITAAGHQWSIVSFLARANYGYKSKYLFTASARRDGSSRFGDNHKWANFYSGAFAWRLNTEDFMKQFTWLSNTKLRASWGMTGNSAISNYKYLPLYATPINGGYMFGNKYSNGSVLDNMGNPDIMWETTYQTDLGIDLGFFKQRLTATIDLYRKDTKNLLMNARLPASTGFSHQTENIGETRNEGLELSVTGVIVENNDFRWVSSFNISFNKNKVLALGEDEFSRQTAMRMGDDWAEIPGYIARIGDPVAAFYGHVWDGVYQLNDFDYVGGEYILKSTIPTNGASRGNIKPGHIKYKDINGDLIVDANDRVVIGDPNPKHIGGFSNKFQYKGFDLNVFFQWSYGNDIINANRLMLESGYKFNTNQYASYADRWSLDNQDSTIPAAKGSAYKTYSTRIVEDGSYLRLKTVTLGYNLPSGLLKKLKIAQVRFYVTGQNLLTWTNYSGYDPEVSIRRSALTPGFDYSAYPRARTYTLGTNITF